MSIWVKMILLLGALTVLLLAIRWAQHRWHWHAEVARKCAHVAMGLTCLSFPWIFTAAWQVILMSCIALIGLAALRSVPELKSGLGKVLGSVTRVSYGEIYFVIAVAATFTLADGNAVLYLVPILVLTLADAVGALVGTGYGRIRFKTDEGTKSLEGSFSFLMVSFLAIHIPLLLFTETGRAESLLIALTLALLVTLMEAMSWRGLDNLFVPITCFVFLTYYIPLDCADLAKRFVVILALAGAALGWRRRTTLTDSAALGSAVFAYIIWGVGGWRWLIAPILIFVLYTYVGKTRGVKVPARDMQAVIRIMAGPVLILFLSEVYQNDGLILPFFATLSAHLANIAISREASPDTTVSPLASRVRAVILSWGVYALVYWLTVQPTVHGALLALAMAIPVTLSAVLFQRTFHHQRTDCPLRIVWLREGILAPGLALLTLTPLTYLVVS